MQLKFIDSDVVYTSIQYDASENYFVISDSGLNYDITCCTETNVIKEYEPQNFKYYLLHNERDDCTENSIFQVFIKHEKKDIRIGWLFPIQALMSISHDYADNIFFNKYAYIAYVLLLNDINSNDEKEFKDEIKLTDYYEDSLQMLLIDQTNLESVPEFDIKDYVISLFFYGYTFNGHGNLVSEIDYHGKNIHLKKIAVQLRNKAILPRLFKNSIVGDYNAEFSRFYAYYQIIEVLISVVFDIEFRKLVAKLKISTSNLFDERDNLSELANEKRRVTKLFGSYTALTGSLEQLLNDKAIDFLQHNGKTQAISLADNVYKTRCMLVHELYNVKPDTDQILKKLNDYLLEVIKEMLFNFKDPVNS